MSGLISSDAEFAPLAVSPTDFRAPANASVDLTAIASTDLLNLSVGGQIFGVIIRLTAAPTGGLLVAKLDFTVDGNSLQALTLWNAADVFTAAAQDLAEVGDGDAIGDKLFVPVSLAFEDSLVVALNVTTAATLGTASGSVPYALSL